MDDLMGRLERMADEGTPRGATAVMSGARTSLLAEPDVVQPMTKEWRVRRGLLVAALVVVVAIVLASVALVTRSTEHKSELPVISESVSYRDLYDTSDQPATGPLYLVPGFVPDGFRVLRVDDTTSAGVVGGSTSVDRIETFARFDATGDQVAEYFQLRWGDGATAVGDQPGAPRDPLAPFRASGTLTTVRGVDGLAGTAVDSGAGELQFAAWEEPPGHMVVLSSPTLSTAYLLAVADSLTALPDGGFQVTRAPDGFVQISSQPGAVSEGSATRDVIYSDAAGRGFVVHIADHSDDTPGANLVLPGNRLVDVNGRHAVVGAHVNSGVSYDDQTQFLNAADQNVQFLEPANTLVTVRAVGLSEDDVLTIARALETVDRSAWERLLASAPGPATPGPVGPVLTSPPPAPEPTFTGDEAAIVDVFHTWVSRPDVDTTVSILEDGDALRDTIEQVRLQNVGAGDHSSTVSAVSMIDDAHALVTFSILTNGQLTLANQQGAAIKIDGSWRVSRATYCATIGLGAVKCPPG